jgi:arylsulfatase A-like enzyme
MRARRTSRRQRDTLRATAILLVTGVMLGACGGRDDPVPKPARNYDAEGRPLVQFDAHASPPSLVLIVIDTLRADALEDPDGPSRMPYLKSEAERGVLCTQATSAAPLTLPSVASLLTGRLPSDHGCLAEDGVPALRPDLTTFAEVLGVAHGYETVALVGGNWSAGPDTVFQGFSHVAPGFALEGTRPFLEDWARGRDRSRPFFLLLHTYEAHHPYGRDNHPYPNLPVPLPEAAAYAQSMTGASPPELVYQLLTDRVAGAALRLREPEVGVQVARFMWRGLRDVPQPAYAAGLRDAYLDGVEWVDALLRGTLAEMRRWGLLDRALLVVTSDHGEAFGEHGLLMHGRDCHDELVRVPLVMSGPPPFVRGARLDASVGLVDVLPTFLELARLPPVVTASGRSFLGMLPSGGPERPVISETRALPAMTGGDSDLHIVSVRTSRWKVILTLDRTTGAVREEAFDLSSDPGEQRNLVPAGGSVASVRFDDELRRSVALARNSIQRAHLLPIPTAKVVLGEEATPR